MSRSILIYGNSILKQVSKPVEGSTPALRRFIDELAQTMYDSDEGVGLAASQVGELIRAVVIDIDHVKTEENPNPRRRLQVFLNPEVIWESDEDGAYNEGCLSIPGVEAKICRPRAVVVRYRNLDFKGLEVRADSFLGRVLQHEIDHLNGILFVDRLNFAQRALIAGKLSRLRQDSGRMALAGREGRSGRPLI